MKRHGHRGAKRLRVPALRRRITSIIFVLVFAGVGGYLLFEARASTPLTTDQVATQFSARRTHYENLLLARSFDKTTLATRQNADLGAAQAMIWFQRCKRGASCDKAYLDKANQRLSDSIDLITSPDFDSGMHHAAAFTYLRVYLTFKGSPDLMYPATATKLKTALQYWRNKLFNKYTVDNINFSIVDYNPWDPKGPGGYNGTENHKLQVIVTGMLLAEVYAGETYNGRPVKDNTPERNDYWHYFRDAFYRYLDSWGNGRNDYFRKDTMEAEKDSPGYAYAYMGDYWMVRDLFQDAVTQKHAEIMIDRLLADWSEDSVKSMYTGQAERNNGFDTASGLNHFGLPANYLLFDNIGYQLPSYKYLFSWDRWAAVSIIASDYNPSHMDFPRAIIEVARNKGDGYMVTDSTFPKANWVEKDLALGFAVFGNVGNEHNAGGFFVHNSQAMPAGLHMFPYFVEDPGCGYEPCNSPFRKRKPHHTLSSVVSRRVAITKSTTTGESAENSKVRFWVQHVGGLSSNYGFDSKIYEITDPAKPTWLFFKERSSEGRDVYSAVRPATGRFSRDTVSGDKTGTVKGGEILVLNNTDGILIWEVSTSEDHSSFEGFIADVKDNSMNVTSSEVTYTSSKLGTTLVLNRSSPSNHKINGALQNLANFNHGFKNPYMQNPHGSKTATINKAGYAATYNWDPDNDNNFDEMPFKSVDNTPGNTSDTTKPSVSITAPAAGSTVSGTLNLAANASDNVGVARVEFFVDNALVSADSQSPYGFAWDSTSKPNGTYLLKATAYDAAGNNASATISVTVNNQTANTAPSVELTAPAEGASFTAPANITINANASDSDGTVTKVEFFQGSTKLGEDTTSPFQYTWANSTAGVYALTAKATDDDGTTSTSSIVNITVQSPPASKPDLVVTAVSMSPANPKAGQAVTFSATIKNQGSGPTPEGVIHGVRFSINGVSAYTWSDSHITSLAPGASITVTANNGTNGVSSWTAVEGSFTVTAWVDDANRINETDGGNNLSKLNLTVTKAPGKPGDFNNSGHIDMSDLSVLLSAINRGDVTRDINSDGKTNMQDLSILLSGFEQ